MIRTTGSLSGRSLSLDSNAKVLGYLRSLRLALESRIAHKSILYPLLVFYCLSTGSSFRKTVFKFSRSIRPSPSYRIACDDDAQIPCYQQKTRGNPRTALLARRNILALNFLPVAKRYGWTFPTMLASSLSLGL
jgi:hypothetical protein